MPRNARLGWAWVALCLAVAVHVTDEALTGFLDVWNPTARSIRAALPWLPLPVFTFRLWLAGLILAVLLLLALSWFAFRDARWVRPAGVFFAAIIIGNGLGHLAATVLGRTVSTVRFPRPAPGFYSAPLLLLAAVHLLRQIFRARDASSGTSGPASRESIP